MNITIYAIVNMCYHARGSYAGQVRIDNTRDPLQVNCEKKS